MIAIISLLQISGSGRMSHISSWCQIKKLWNLLVRLLTKIIEECGGGCIPTRRGGSPRLAVGSFPAVTVLRNNYWDEVKSGAATSKELFLPYAGSSHIVTPSNTEIHKTYPVIIPNMTHPALMWLWLWLERSHLRITDNSLLCLKNKCKHALGFAGQRVNAILFFTVYLHALELQAAVSV